MSWEIKLLPKRFFWKLAKWWDLFNKSFAGNQEPLAGKWKQTPGKVSRNQRQGLGMQDHYLATTSHSKSRRCVKSGLQTWGCQPNQTKPAVLSEPGGHDDLGRGRRHPRLNDHGRRAPRHQRSKCGDKNEHFFLLYSESGVSCKLTTCSYVCITGPYSAYKSGGRRRSIKLLSQELDGIPPKAN